MLNNSITACQSFPRSTERNPTGMSRTTKVKQGHSLRLRPWIGFHKWIPNSWLVYNQIFGLEMGNLGVPWLRKPPSPWRHWNGGRGRSSANGLRVEALFQPMSIYVSHFYLVGGLEHVLFSIVYGIILPFDLYFSEGLKPPTSYVSEVL